MYFDFYVILHDRQTSEGIKRPVLIKELAAGTDYC